MYSILILTHLNKHTGKPLLPHYDKIKASNPNAPIFIVVGEDSPHGKRYNWKNGDKPLRKWWCENGLLIKTDQVAVIEWDTLINCPLPDFPQEFDLVGKWLMKEPLHLKGKWKRKKQNSPDWHQDYWWWWNEIPLLELTEDEQAYGLVSFGCLLMKTWVLDALCDPRWDSVYEKSIQNELRFPSVVAAEGAKIGEIDLPYVHYEKMTFDGKQEIYHPIKTEQ